MTVRPNPRPLRARRTGGRRPPVSGLAALFPNRTLVNVLTLLVLHPEEEFYQRAISARTGSGLLQAQRALRRVEAAGLVTKSNRGNRAYYSVCREHPAFEDLKRLLLRTVALGDALRDALVPLEGKLSVAFVYGSVARGEESQTSDIDLFAVGDISLRMASRVLGPAGRRLGREFNPILYSARELRARMRSGERFLADVLTGPKIWLIGNDDVLA